MFFIIKFEATLMSNVVCVYLQGVAKAQNESKYIPEVDSYTQLH
jgi:hypothetical protein